MPSFNKLPKVNNMSVTVLVEMMKAQIAKPAKACVNFEASFVRSNLANAGYDELARQYWNWFCTKSRTAEIFGSEVVRLQEVLDAIDKGCTLPSWATYGT